jgi:aspartate carbamoyltransferase catalytic subunit
MEKHLLNTSQVKVGQLETLFREADMMRNDPWRVGVDPVVLARGRVLAIIKDESSTRTRVSFEVAMKRMGGDVVLLDLDKRSSIAKGESVEDTVRTVAEYVDAIVMRHSQKWMVQTCSKVSRVPIINAGDGDNEHPTQALLDMYTIYREIGRLHNLNIMFVGDLKHSRCVHSLIRLLKLYPANCLYLCSPSDMRLPESYECDSDAVSDMPLDMLRHFGDDLDVLYMTRSQKERHICVTETTPYFTFGVDEARYISSDCKVLHPLPRNQEISVEFDSDPRAAYFRQAQNGMYIRMVLLNSLFREGDFFAPSLSKT